MVAAVGHKEDGLREIFVEDRGDDGQVRQVAASSSWVIGKNDISSLEVASLSSHLMAHSILHSTKVHRDVRRVRDETAVRSKEGTTEVKSLFDVGRY